MARVVGNLSANSTASDSHIALNSTSREPNSSCQTSSGVHDAFTAPAKSRPRNGNPCSCGASTIGSGLYLTTSQRGRL